MSIDSAANSNASTKDWHASKHIGKRARYLLEHPDEEIPSDVSFLVGDGQSEPQKIFKCHKFLLAMVSSMFQTMFYGSFPQTDGPIKIPAVTPTAFQHMLRYAYGEIIPSGDLGSLEDALDTLHCAKMYLIDKLADICRDRIHYLLGTFQEDPCIVFQRAPQMDEEDLAALALARIALNTPDVMQGNGLLRLSLDCLKKIVAYPHLNAEEPDIFQGVLRWVEHNVAAVKDCTLLDAFGSLLYSINFHQFTPFKLTDRPAADGPLSAEEVSRTSQLLLDDMTPVLPFLFTPCSPLASPLICTFDRKVYNAQKREFHDYCLRKGLDSQLVQHSTAFFIEARPDLAPECCAFLRHLLEAKFNIGIAFYGDSHPRSCCCALASNLSEVPAAVAKECNVIPHSAKGACWFEWDLGYRLTMVRIGVNRKPHLQHSALLGIEDDENQWEPFASWDDKRIEEVAGFNMFLSKIT